MRIVQPINAGWNFRKMDPVEEWQSVNLPHTYNNVDGQDGSQMYRGPVEYCKTVTIPAEPGKVHYLEVGAASLASEVIVNGHSCYQGSCGYSLYRVKLDEYLKDGENEILFKITNGSTAKLYPAMADFSFYGGLYRGVNLITEDAIHLQETDLSRDGIVLIPEVTEGGKGKLTVTANIVVENDCKTVKAAVKLLTAEGEAVACAERTVDVCHEGKLTFELGVEQVHLWDGLEDPYLYTTVVTLADAEGQVMDERQLKTGFRTVCYTTEKGFMLNGKPIKLNGVARHADFGGIGNAVTRETMALDMSIIKEIGTNSLRCSHYQHPDDWYDMCDREGLLVWAEVPVISVVAQNPDADQNAFDQLERLIAQARNHCCIYCWGVQNEVCMGSNNAYTHELTRKLSVFAKELDPTRMTSQANEASTQDDCPILNHTDISGHNFYFGWYYGEIPELQDRLDNIHALHPDTPMILTEYGVDTNVKYHSAEPKNHDYTEEYQLKFIANALKTIDERLFMAGGYVWNMFDFGSAGRDEGGTKGKNQKGLVTIDRKIKKDAFYLYKAHWSKVPFVHIAGRRFVNRPQTETDITILSNMEQFTLTVNGHVVGTKASQGDITVFEKVAICPGENSIVVEASNADGKHDIDRIKVCSVSEPDPSYTNPPQKRVVIDWFEGLDSDEFGIEEAPIRPEGFTFDDILQDIYDNPKAREVFLKYLRPLTQNARFEGMKPFTTVKGLLDFANRDKSIPEALLNHCEHELNKIDK